MGMADFQQARVFRGPGRKRPLQNSSNRALSELLHACYRRELPGRWLGYSRESQDAAGVAGSTLLAEHNTLSDMGFRVRGFSPGRTLWRSNAAARDDLVHLSCRDRTVRNRSANRHETFVGAPQRFPISTHVGA